MPKNLLHSDTALPMIKPDNDWRPFLLLQRQQGFWLLTVEQYGVRA
jgi:hypothetical protein